MKSVGCCREKRIPPPASLVPLVLSGPLCPAGISPPRGESPFSREAYILLANAVKIKVTRLHQKTPEYHITDTGKGNNRRWQAQADSEERANSAGRFRHDCTRKLLSSGKSAGRCGRSPYLFQGRLQCTYNRPKNEQIASRNQG